MSRAERRLNQKRVIKKKRASPSLPPVRDHHDGVVDADSPLVAREAYTIHEFCAAYRMSAAFFWKLQRAGLAPRAMKIGRRVMISVDAAREWKREREQAVS